MMNRLLTFMATLLLLAGCASREGGEDKSTTIPLNPSEEGKALSDGDSTIYALAAAGSNDSVLVFLRLPYRGADPDTVDILDALESRQVFGRPEVGDNVAIVLGADCVADSSAADCVADSVIDSTMVSVPRHAKARCIIVTEKLAGRWCYEVSPRLRRRMGEGPLPERLRKMLEEKREYGMMLKLSGEAFSMGSHARASDEQLPVVWPRAKNYGRWAIFNGRLVLSEVKRDTAGVATVVGSDTADFVRLRRDTLVLRFSDGERKYYRSEE